MSKWVVRNGLGRYLGGWVFEGGTCCVLWALKRSSQVTLRSRQAAEELVSRFRREVRDADDLSVPVNQLRIERVRQWGR
mgnify:CR=1 FL=1